MYALFDGLMRRLGELNEEYDVSQSHIIAGYMARAAEAQREATSELTGHPAP